MANENKDNSSLRVYLFVFFSVLLLALSVWVVWDDEFGLRPWKKYQEDYKTLKHDKLERDYRKAVVEFERSGGHKKLAELEERLKKAEALFQSKGVQARYEKLNKQFNTVHDQAAKNQKELQNSWILLREKYSKMKMSSRKVPNPRNIPTRGSMRLGLNLK